ncbi:hypothetical protein MRX96_035635 [Rhipicephalus microplus]
MRALIRRFFRHRVNRRIRVYTVAWRRARDQFIKTGEADVAAELLAALPSVAARGCVGSRQAWPACVRGRLARRARDSVPTLDARLPSHHPSPPLLLSIAPLGGGRCLLLRKRGYASNRSRFLRDRRALLSASLAERGAYLRAATSRAGHSVTVGAGSVLAACAPLPCHPSCCAATTPSPTQSTVLLLLPEWSFVVATDCC